MKLEKFLEFFEFSYKKYEDGYGLVDLLGANWGDIEAERHDEPWGLVYRFDGTKYVYDYVYTDLEENGYTGSETLEEMYNYAKYKLPSVAEIIYTLMNPETVQL